MYSELKVESGGSISRNITVQSPIVTFDIMLGPPVPPPLYKWITVPSSQGVKRNTYSSVWYIVKDWQTCNCLTELDKEREHRISKISTTAHQRIHSFSSLHQISDMPHSFSRKNKFHLHNVNAPLQYSKQHFKITQLQVSPLFLGQSGKPRGENGSRTDLPLLASSPSLLPPQFLAVLYLVTQGYGTLGGRH